MVSDDEIAALIGDCIRSGKSNHEMARVLRDALGLNAERLRVIIDAEHLPDEALYRPGGIHLADVIVAKWESPIDD